MSSEFGKGCAYCLGLFLAHSERDYYLPTDKKGGILNRPGLWFYGAADHLFDLQIPASFPYALKKRLDKFQSKVLHLRLPMDGKEATDEDRKWAINEAKELLRLIDKQIGVKVIKGDWE